MSPRPEAANISRIRFSLGCAIRSLPRPGLSLVLIPPSSGCHTIGLAAQRRHRSTQRARRWLPGPSARLPGSGTGDEVKYPAELAVGVPAAGFQLNRGHGPDLVEISGDVHPVGEKPHAVPRLW